MSKISFQVGNIDLIGESDVRRVCVESVSRSQPVELEREVNCAADGGGAEHCLENVGLKFFIILLIMMISIIMVPACCEAKTSPYSFHW